MCSFCGREYIWQYQAQKCEKNHFCACCNKILENNEGIFYGKRKFHKNCLKELLLEIGDAFAIEELGLDDMDDKKGEKNA